MRGWGATLPALAAALVAGWTGAAAAQDAAEAMARARTLTGAVPRCPPTARTGDSVTVCGRRGESPYRIPGVIRDAPQPRKAGAATAWGTQTMWAEDAARGGRPGSSSVDGAGGQTGLAKAIRREWELERQAIDARRTTPPK